MRLACWSIACSDIESPSFRPMVAFGEASLTFPVAVGLLQHEMLLMQKTRCGVCFLDLYAAQ